MYYSPSIIRTMRSRRVRWAWQVARMRAKKNASRILMGQTEIKRQLGRRRRSWVNTNKMDLREVGWNGLIWLRMETSGGLL
jgi:hypothetical protein